jgi:hypothetical protein
MRLLPVSAAHAHLFTQPTRSVHTVAIGAREGDTMNTRWRVLCCGLSALAVLYFKGAGATVGTDPPAAPAQSVGAPSRHESGCRTNIEVLFTADPQAQLLEAPHAANLAKNLNVELGELRVRMLQEIEAR